MAMVVANVCAVAPADAAKRVRERDVERRLCATVEQESWRRASRTRIDCVSPSHAIEIDWSGKWAEAAGQSMFAASKRHLVPGVVLICARRTSRASCDRHVDHLRDLFWSYSIRATIWQCPTSAKALAVCRRQEIRR